MDYEQFFDDFYSNLSYKNAYSLCSQPLPRTLLWSAYTSPNVYGCQLDGEWIGVKGNSLVYVMR